MDIVAVDQILIVGGFLAALFALRWGVQAHKGTLKSKITQDRRMVLGEVTALGPDTRAMILTIDQREFLVVTAKRQPPVITPLGAAPDSAEIALDAQTLARIAA